MFFRDSYLPPEPEPDGPEKTGVRRFLEILQQESAALLKLNLLFLLACIPVVTIPPALFALNQTARAMAAGRPARCRPGFFSSFRRYWKTACGAFFLTVLPQAAAGVGMSFYLGFAAANPIFYLPFMLCSTIFLVSLLASAYLYGLLADGRVLDKGTLRLALALGMGKPFRAVLAALCYYVPLAAAVLWFPLSGIYLLLIGFALPCLLGNFFLRTVLEPYHTSS